MSGPLSVPDFESSRPTRRAGETKRLTLGHAAVFLGALVLITLASLPPRPNPERLLDMRVGEAATRSVLAPFPLKVLDVEKTELRRKEAADKTPPTYTPRPETSRRARLKWETLVALVADEKTFPATQEVLVRQARAFLASLTDPDQKLLKRKLADPIWRGSVISKFTRALDEKEIVAIDPQSQTEAPGAGAPVLWRLREADGSLQDRVSWVSVESVTQQAEILGRTILETDFGADEKAKQLAMALASEFVEPNLEFDSATTENDRRAARASVPSVSIEFKQNQRLVARGELVTEDQKRALAELSARMQSRFGDVLGRMLLIAVMLEVIFGYLRRNHSSIYQSLPRLAAFLGQISLVAWSGLVVAWGVEFNAFQGSEESVGMVGLVVPVASAGIMISLLENSRLALFSVIMSSFLVGIQFNWGFEILLILALTGILAVFQVAGISRRSQVYWVIPWILGAGGLMITGVHMILYPSWEASRHYMGSLLWGWMFLGINALLSVGIALLLLPMLEDLLGITTIFKLREVSTYHPLLRQLEEKAPGTYYHSLNVSALAESAAGAIGANAVLVKVGAYYHDIGKMEKPSYFVENQFTEEDRRKHSKISPHMSCLIIRNHVKLGIEMAREQRLPEAIIPFIAEHHGTTLLSYFYDQARSEDPHGTVSEADFRYPGPKPQTIESAVLMLADTIEAASRTMKLVGEGEIRIFVKRIINDKMVDGQFDECNLTFRQLRILSDSFTRTLRTMMHRRIAYPSMPEVERIPGEPKEEKVQPLFSRGA